MRKTVTVTEYKSDISGADISKSAEAQVLEIRIKQVNKPGSKIVVLDALPTDKLTGTVKDLLGKGREEAPRGRRKKN